MEYESIILGAGLTGLSLSHFLDRKSLILEKDKTIGGLCRTFKKGPFSYDIGGHIMFSKDKEILDFMVKILGNNVKKLYRNNKVYIKGKYLKYPFENGLNALEKEDIFYCLYNFLKNDYPKPKNFKEWIYHRFGKGIGELYLEPYNKKIWKYPLEKMSLGWVERVPKPPIEDIIKSALGIETEGYTHQLYFYYPKIGGIQSLVESIREKSKNKSGLITDFKIKSIKKINNTWEITDGTNAYKTTTLISSIPIFELIKLVEGIPPKVKDAVNKLVFNRMYIVLIGLNNPNLKDKTALYVPDKDIIFHRIVFNKYFGEEYTSKSKSAITAEITFAPESGLESQSEKDIIEKVIEDLIKLKLIKKEEVCDTDFKKIEYAYVVYDKDYDKNIKLIKEYFNKIGIHLCGRFAEFQYLNMDACIRHSFELAKELNKK